LAISSFHTHIIGAEQPVGRYLSRLLAEQNLIHRGVTLASDERPMLQASARPVYVVIPTLNDDSELDAARVWVEKAQEEGAVILFVSTLHRFAQSDTTVNESAAPSDSTNLANRFAELESLVSQNAQHIILRVGQLLTLEGGDFASQILAHIRSQPKLALDMQKQFEPTPVDDVAIVILAMLRQINLADDLWGVYHFSGVEPVSSYAFAEALLAEAGQFEDLSQVELTTEQGAMMPQVWAPVAEHNVIFHTFGIKQKAWRQGLARLVRAYYDDVVEA
jgi:dTDP-4-dehydrorhamnose reductase